MTDATTSSPALPAGSTADLTSFLGRAQELELIRQLFAGGRVRLLTLTGPAGVGKTRLALEVAQRCGDAFPDGVCWHDLTPIRDLARVPSALAENLGLPDTGPRPVLTRLSVYLQARETLLILDNFEQVLPVTPVLDTLLDAAPRLRFLVTSREPLHLRTEQTIPVLPLALPDPDRLPPLDQLAQVPSVALFLQRARAIDPAFRLTDENARAVAELCVHLDGLPLAIELAAARTAVLSPQMIVERLEQRLSLLHWEAQDLPERQRTLRSAIAWSYELLADGERGLFRCLSVFVGGFTLEAAEAIAGVPPDDAIDVLESVASLVDKSLVQREDDGAGGHRLRLLESVREYAIEQVARCDEAEITARAHAEYFLELAELAAPQLVGPTQRAWYLRLEEELGNLQAAFRWLLDHGERWRALRLAAALGHFWEVRGYLREGQQALEEALACAPDADPRLRAKVLNRLGSLLLWRGETERSRVVIEEALAVGRALEDPDIIARSLTHLVRRTIFVRTSEESMRGAVPVLEEALALRQQIGDRRGAANIRTQLAYIAFGLRAYDQAEHLGKAALTVYRELSDHAGATVPLVILGFTAARRGDAPQAVTLLRQGLEACSHLRSRRLLLLLSDAVLGWLGAEQGAAEEVAMLFGATDVMDDTVGTAVQWRSELRTPEAIAALQVHLGTERWEAALRAGRSLSFGQISQLVSRILGNVRAGGSDAEGTGGERRQPSLLSKREEEVLRLVAEGLTNEEIARRLFITKSTVKTHVASVLNKLGVESRTQAVTVAAHQGLLDGVTGRGAADD